MGRWQHLTGWAHEALSRRAELCPDSDARLPAVRTRTRESDGRGGKARDIVAALKLLKQRKVTSQTEQRIAIFGSEGKREGRRVQPPIYISGNFKSRRNRLLPCGGQRIQPGPEPGLSHTSGKLSAQGRGRGVGEEAEGGGRAGRLTIGC